MAESFSDVRQGFPYEFKVVLKNHEDIPLSAGSTVVFVQWLSELVKEAWVQNMRQWYF